MVLTMYNGNTLVGFLYRALAQIVPPVYKALAPSPLHGPSPISIFKPSVKQFGGHQSFL